MLAGIYDPRAQGNPERLAAQLQALSKQDEVATTVAGPLAFVTAGPITVAGDSQSGFVFEGSLYNAPELAQELEVGAEDAADVLRVAVGRWGVEGALERLRGGFNLLGWSEGGRSALLAQDQVCIRCLFIHRQGERIAFASEIRDLLPLLPHSPEPDEVSLVRELAGLGLYEGRTLIAGVRRLGYGRRMRLREGGAEVSRYWVAAEEEPLRGSRLEIAAEFGQALVDAVAMRIRGLDTVGVTLSGGFDSSAVAAAASAGPESPVLRGYSAVFPGEEGMDDRDLLDALDRDLSLESSRYRPEKEGTFGLCLAYMRDWRLPLSGPGWTIEYPLLTRAREDGVQAMLDGQGGDEIFGFAPYLLADRLRRGRLLSAIELTRRGIPGAREGAPWRAVAAYVRLFGLRAAFPHSLYSLAQRFSRPSHNAPFFLDRKAARTLADSSDDLYWYKGENGPRWWLYLRSLLLEEREAAGLGDYTRHRSEWFGFEGRPPLFDVELIRTALRIPPELGFDGYLNRPLSREAMAGMLPDEVRLSRRKSNLGPFYLQMLAVNELAQIREVLGTDRLEIAPYVRGEKVRDLLDRPPAPDQPDWEYRLTVLWSCFTTELWLRTLSDPDLPQRLLEEKQLPMPRGTVVS